MPKDLYRYFRVEARELLDGLAKAMLQIEKTGAGAEIVGHALRLAHTLKGAARVVKEAAIAEQAHAIEELLAPHRDGGAPLPSPKINDVLGRLDAIGGRLSALEPPRPEPSAAPSSSPPAPADDTITSVRVEIADLDSLLHGVSEAMVQLTALRRAVARAGGERDRRDLDAGLDAVEGELGQVAELAGQLRLLPASSLFPVLERAARDAADSLGKRVEFAAAGGDHRLEAHILAGLRGALLHVVRNAVAHGIEPAPQRAAAGKPAAGRVTVDVERRGHKLAFLCRDDGAGIDVEAVRAAATRSGRLAAREAAALAADAVLRLLLEPGVTTAGATTQVAGRGIGLDVVRTTAQRLRGDVTLKSEPGRGTTLEILVPSSLSSVRSLEVHAGDRVAFVPLAAVSATTRIAADAIGRSAAGETLLHGDVAIPFVTLAEALDPGAAAPKRRAWSTLILDAPSGRAAIGVDRLAGIQDVVVLPLPALARAGAAVTGASLDADGNPQLALDPDGLVAAARRRRPAELPAPAPRLPVLIVDDSLTTRMLEQNILETAGYTVELATSAEEALVKARGTAYSLFLVDVEMPGMDGFSFIERTQAESALRSTPAILVTSRSGAEDRLRGERVGARGYIVKGEFDQGRLLTMIRELIG